MYKKTLLVAAAVLSLSCVSCVSTRYPIPVSDGELQFSNPEIHGNIVLGIDGRFPTVGPVPYNMDRLIDTFRKSGIFKEVGYIDQLKYQPHLILYDYWMKYPRRMHGEGGGIFCNAVGNLYLTALTIGIIPTYCNFDDSISFKIKQNDGNEIAQIAFTYDGKWMMGWLANVMYLFPNWDGAHEQDRYSSMYGRLVLREIKKHIDKSGLQRDSTAPKCSDGAAGR